MTLRGHSRLVAAFGAVVALTITAPASAGAAKATTGKPSVGQCRSLTMAQASAASDTSSPTRCSGAHNDRVIAVPNLPKGVSYGELNTAGKVRTVAVRLCYRPFRKALGQTDLVRDMTAYSYLYFVPTAQQRAKGAHWLRCDLTLRHGLTLGNLPTDRKPALTRKKVAANVRRCLTGGASPVTTSCTTKHRYRAAGAVKIAIKKYPGRKAMVKIGHNRCPAITTTDADYRFTWSSKTVWNVAEDHTLVCYNRQG